MLDWVPNARLQMNKTHFLKFEPLHLPESKDKLAKEANL